MRPGSRSSKEKRGPARREPVAPRARSPRTSPPPRPSLPPPGLAFAVHGGCGSASTRRRGRLFFSSFSCSESLPCHVTPVHSASVDARARCHRKPRPLARPPSRRGGRARLRPEWRCCLGAALAPRLSTRESSLVACLEARPSPCLPRLPAGGPALLTALT